MTGYTIGEYIRNRRLYLAALDINAKNEKVIDVAYKYGYDTPESFTKAFKRFHGVTPQQLSKDASNIKTFLPLKVTISILGGNDMDYAVEEMKEFEIIGFEKIFSFSNAYEEIPKFWGEVFQTHIKDLLSKEKPETEMEQAIRDNCIGEFGASIVDCEDKSTFRYIVGGPYRGGKVPEGMTVYRFPDLKWAKFNCVGPMPTALQSVNTKIFKEWLPENQEYEIAMNANIEWYSSAGDTKDANYKSAIWIPVKEK